jgi:hypothetical protein
MHSIMLFGSVLASDNSDPGVLYERSCGSTPLILVLGNPAMRCHTDHRRSVLM